jgi:hypothetical protein
MTPAQWPRGIDVERAMRRWQSRRSAGRLKKTIERLAAEAPTLAWFNAAVGAFIAECERCSCSSTPPSRRLSIRLVRFYAQHFRRQIVGQRRFVEAAAWWALMGDTA